MPPCRLPLREKALGLCLKTNARLTFTCVKERHRSKLAVCGGSPSPPAQGAVSAGAEGAGPPAQPPHVDSSSEPSACL